MALPGNDATNNACKSSGSRTELQQQQQQHWRRSGRGLLLCCLTASIAAAPFSNPISLAHSLLCDEPSTLCTNLIVISMQVFEKQPRSASLCMQRRELRNAAGGSLDKEGEAFLPRVCPLAAASEMFFLPVGLLPLPVVSVRLDGTPPPPSEPSARCVCVCVC